MSEALGRGMRSLKSRLERHKAYIIGGAVRRGMISLESWLDRYKDQSYGWRDIKPRVMVG
jgi:hypothetical protein